MISALIQLSNISQKIEEIDKKLKAIQEDLLVLKAQSSKARNPWEAEFSLGDK